MATLVPNDMYEEPPNHGLNMIAAAGFVCIFTLAMSSQATWLSWFPKREGAYEIYRKQGEYGEWEKRSWLSRLPFQEPLNAVTSLAYTFFGLVVVITGLNDIFKADKPVTNRIIESGSFSILYGLANTYLGISSFFFHASHAESWRKADAGMTSGVIVPPVVFSIWDRVRLPGVEDSTVMIGAAVVLMLSLTHGFLPYGSSDILLPALVATTWGLEMLPRFGGVVSAYQFVAWQQCVLSVLIGTTLRIADIKRKNVSVKNTVMMVSSFIVLVFAYLLGFQDPLVIAGACAIAVVAMDVTLGHIFWHIFSAYALYLWWFQFRTRPGDPETPRSSDVSLVAVLFFIALKNAVRRTFMTMPFPNAAVRDRVLFLLEHIVFAACAYYVIVAEPNGGVDYPSENNSWLLQPKLCWELPVYEFTYFELFYLAKVGTHVEDVLYLYISTTQQAGDGAGNDNGSGGGKETGDGKRGPNGGVEEELPLLNVPSKEDNKNKLDVPRARPQPKKKVDKIMLVHHVVTALLCMSSAYYGYAKIGSLIMFLHDVSDIPLDLVRLFGQFNMKSAQLVSFGATLLSWAYWRLFWFPTEVLYSIAAESKSLITLTTCEIGSCTLMQVPERVPFLIMLGTLYCLHVFWFFLMLRKARRAFKPSS